MDSLELNKIVGAILVGGMVALVSGIVADNLIEPRQATQTAMTVPEGEAGAPAPEEPEALEPVIPLLASADLAKGEAAFKKCAACHTIDKGGANKVGPNLWGVVGAPHAHRQDYAYSDAIKEKPGKWDYASLNHWLASPKTYAPGTKMTFAGIKKAEERANLIAWLRTKADSPLPLPDQAAIDAAKAEAQGQSAEAGQTGAEGGEATGAAAPSEETGGTGAPTEETAGGAGGEQTAAAPASAIAELMKTADAAAGEKAAKKCAACHTFDQGGANKIGPNLWNIVGAKRAHLDNYKYSDAMKNAGGEWSYEELDKYLEAPKKVVPGTKMTFAGVKKPEERADIIAYLRSLSDSPKPLP